MKKKILIGIVLCTLMFAAAGCKKKAKKEEPSPTPTEELEEMIPTDEPTGTDTPTPTEAEEEVRDGQVRSKLTGEWVDEDVAKMRPYAVMLNNIKAANPQSGTSEAAIIYEALVEGGITRMMGIYEDLYDEDGKLLERIGSTRSARHYYVSFADEYDAIYVHFGETKYATKKIKKLGIDTLSGLTGIGNTVFYRDNHIKAPHNAFASGEGILAGTKHQKYRTEYEEGYEGHYTFYKEDTDLDSTTKVNRLTLKYSSFTPYFTYDEGTKLYSRFQFGGEHIDYNTKKQLTFKNIIVQFVHEYNIDKNGYQTMDIEDNKGEGFYITNGTAVPITWSKNEKTRKMRYYNQAGEELTINPGKTFISIFPDSRKNDVLFE